MARRDISITSRVRRGMRVRSSDGLFLGRVADVWCGDEKKGGEEWDEAVCSRLEIHPATSGLLQRLTRRRRPASPALYVPCGAIAEVSGKRIELGVEARVATERWTGEPMWIRKARAQLELAATARQGAYDGGPEFQHSGSDGGGMM